MLRLQTLLAWLRYGKEGGGRLHSVRAFVQY